MSGKKEVKRERVEYLEDLLSFRRDIKTELSCLGRGELLSEKGKN